VHPLQVLRLLRSLQQNSFSRRRNDNLLCARTWLGEAIRFYPLFTIDSHGAVQVITSATVLWRNQALLREMRMLPARYGWQAKMRHSPNCQWIKQLRNLTVLS